MRTRPPPHRVKVEKSPKGRGRGKMVHRGPSAVLRRHSQGRVLRDLHPMRGPPRTLQTRQGEGVGRRLLSRLAASSWTRSSGGVKRRRSGGSSGSRSRPSGPGVTPGCGSRPPGRAGPTRSLPGKPWSRPGRSGMGRLTAGNGSAGRWRSTEAVCSSPLLRAPEGICTPARDRSAHTWARSVNFSPRSTRPARSKGSRRCPGRFWSDSNQRGGAVRVKYPARPLAEFPRRPAEALWRSGTRRP